MDEKLGYISTPRRDRRDIRRLCKRSLTALAAVSLLVLAALRKDVQRWVGLPRLQPVESAPGALPLDEELRWLDIKPSRTLEWHLCLDAQFDCARLDVPMDWQDPTDDERVVLAIIRLRAKNRTDYRGPVIFNPGGPGGSGVWALRDHGKLLQTIVGDNHDIVSFDPRGIGASIPRIECWDTAQSRRFWQLQDVGVVDAHPGVLYDAFARAAAFSQVCETALDGSGILRHSSTTYHARDMLEILDQMGEEKLKYWGFSYGTILGGTFASMYPDRVGRLVSDGNVDYREWYFGVHINFLHDTDRVMEAFYELCHLAGPLKCAFYAPSPAAVRKRLDDLLAAIRVNPVIVPPSAAGPDMPELITYSKVRKLISTTLYQPVRMFARTARILAALEKGDGRLFYEVILHGDSTSSVCSLETIPPTVPVSGPFEDTDDAFPAIMCSDSEPVNDTVESFQEYANRLQEISTAAGAVNVLFRLSCVGRTVRPKWRFAGPFGGNTSFPILYVANVADNVTPLISARNNSALFPGSRILVQNSYGHTSLSAASTCTARYIRDYFQNGALPPPYPDAVCEPDVSPFGLDLQDKGGGTADIDGFDGELSWAIRTLADQTDWSRALMSPVL
ncbi:hypothetical protein VTK73DRAFT_8068 [Phialemonium thermophilum]|uniref:AB hydrolase-1 domain-containing protein n=1 Tax=Phialemonium thermophilum TaxID=223376 RepID=A0ABR3XRB1_9PEZI